ncbi:MAG: cytoskeletal protein CcmA (bactofilin family) [Saprospiraceae bacterium]|jgi:cytoskeletal protein CcmA (bactofilin family)|tara:strand:+ start:165 stop:611 length:447 start_codon:yes stop_codon:yes gene_type:complete
MFGGKEKSGTVKSNISSASVGALNTLVEGTVIEGQVTAKSDIRIDGMIRGNLNCEGKVIIGITGFIEGQINCTNAVIQGKFEGTLNVKELLNVRESAKINGEVTTGKLIVESGAVFNVTCKMGKQTAENGNATERKSTQVKRLKKEAS